MSVATKHDQLKLAALVSDSGPTAPVGGNLDMQSAPTSREAFREALRSAIRYGNLPPGARFKPAKDIAQIVGLGRSTVGAALSDLVYDGLIETEPAAGGKRVAHRRSRLRVHVTPTLDELEAPFAEYQDLLGFIADLEPRERQWRQLFRGQLVAEVRVRSNPRCWSPPSTWHWADPIGPDQTDSSAVAMRKISLQGQRWLEATIETTSNDGACWVQVTLRDELFSVHVQ